MVINDGYFGCLKLSKKTQNKFDEHVLLVNLVLFTKKSTQIPYFFTIFTS